jgi:sterol desaturase/sphingolipid hydroxylase (fatty acid hydroxylase superfamily)
MWTFLAHILSYDVWFYITHVLLHTRALYWVHRVHHEKQVPAFWDTYHGHWFETPFQSLGFFLPFVLMTVNPVESGVALVAINLHGLLRHDPRGVWLVGRHHLNHHLYGKGNYGSYWIDWLCGTCLPPLSNEDTALEDAPQVQSGVLQEDTVREDGIHPAVKLSSVQKLL